MIFNKNDVIKDINNEKIQILDVLGEGGQGTVYLVDYNNSKLALKVYKSKVTPEFRHNLKNNILKGSPSKDFLWPKKLLEFKDGTIGYLMDLRPSNYYSFVKYLNGNVIFNSTYTLISWCIELCKSFKELHVHGYSYQDLNDGSFFLNPSTGDLLICDNDNVTADKKNLGVLGKMRYMAPEIVRGDKNTTTKESQMPDVHTDRFSLAVILFLALCLGNPFEGECLKNYDIIDERAEKEIFGTKPLFIYHKTNSSNRPIRGYHSAVIKRWPLLPNYVKEAFHRTFVDGLVDRENGRTTEIEWIKILSKYRDELVSCSCGKQFIYGFSEKKENLICPFCKSKRNNFTYLFINKQQIILEPGKNLYMSHLDKYSSDYNNAVAVVIKNKNNPALWGIKLNLDNDVLIKDNLGVEKTISSKGVIPIVKGLKIKIGEEVGEIKG